MSGISSVYPAPPWYYKLFTKENLAKLKEKQSGDASVDQEVDQEEPALEYLQPPEPLQEGGYSNFGSIWQVNDKLMPLSEAGVEQLYSELDKSEESVQANHQSRVWELKKLLKSLLVNFLELIKIMSVNPEKFPVKVEDIRIILINMHHLLNEYRPHQSRESLVLLMEEQIQKTKEEIKAIRQGNKDIYTEITNLASQFASSAENGAGGDESLFDSDTTIPNAANSNSMEVDFLQTANEHLAQPASLNPSEKSTEASTRHSSQRKEDMHLWSLI